ncbi:MAG: hypothetical protein PGN24_08330 [Microbacterium arborescens]
MTTTDPSAAPGPHPGDDDRTTEVLTPSYDALGAASDDTVETATAGMEAIAISASDASGDPVASPGADRPRTRWAGIVWGLAFAAVAGAGLSLVTTPAAFDAAVDGLAAVTAPTLIAAGLLVAGAALLLSGIVGLLRRVQRRTQRHTA